MVFVLERVLRCLDVEFNGQSPSPFLLRKTFEDSRCLELELFALSPSTRGMVSVGVDEQDA